MEQEIRFCATDLGRIAFATAGEGPALVMPPPWVGHLEAQWEYEPFRRFATALGERHTFVRYDALGSGLSERRREDRRFSLETEVHILREVLATLGIERCTLFGFSTAGSTAAAFAAAHPERVQRLVLYGTFANGSRLGDDESRRALPELITKNPGLGSRVLASVFLPDPSPQDLSRFVEFQRRAATPAIVARLLRYAYELDASEAYGEVRAPTLVLHRRGDVAVPYELGIEVASLVPGARFEPLEGTAHWPWLGDAAAVLHKMAAFVRLGPYLLEGETAPPHDEIEPLTAREREILALVAEGLSDGEIAERLVISPHTVHRHVANIRAKLRQPSRAAAAAAATRLDLI